MGGPRAIYPLHGAVKSGDVSKLRRILRAGGLTITMVQLSARDGKGWSPLGLACKVRGGGGGGAG